METGDLGRIQNKVVAREAAVLDEEVVEAAGEVRRAFEHLLDQIGRKLLVDDSGLVERGLERVGVAVALFRTVGVLLRDVVGRILIGGG